MFPILCFERQWENVRHLQAVHRFSSLSYDWNLIFVQTCCRIVVFDTLNTPSFSSTTIDSLTHITVRFFVFHTETTSMISLEVQFVFSIHSSTISTYCDTNSLRMARLFLKTQNKYSFPSLLVPSPNISPGKERIDPSWSF